MQTFNYSNLQCFETVGGATGRASGTCKNWELVCCWWWFAGALHVLPPKVADVCHWHQKRVGNTTCQDFLK